jgi:DMSO/TMAO reductase YedYZ molybdopterin-dependent catalytic subunit
MHASLIPICLAAGLASAAKTELECGPVAVDAGIVPQGSVVRLERTCRNEGATSIALFPPRTACTCLTARFDRRTLAPRAGATLQLVLQTAPLADRVEFAVDIPLKNPDSIGLTLMVSADVRPSVIAVPEYVDMGDYRRSPERQVLIVDTTGRSFSIRQATSARSEVDVRWTAVELVRMGDHWEPATTRGAVTGYQITLSARPEPGRKSLSDEIQIELTNELQKSLRLRVVGYSP